MVLKVKLKIPLNGVKVSRVVLISGLMTFLYCIEFSIGIRTVYHTFRIWNTMTLESQDKHVSWKLCVACFLTATISFFCVNVLSAIWEQRQLEEREKAKSPIRFAFHLVVGGMIWRYISIWFIDSKEFQKKGALLLTMTKFLFTQTFTVPMVIVHACVSEQLEEVMYDVCSVFCISVNLILTCTMFSLCSKEVEEVKKWDFATLDLVPLIFLSGPVADAEESGKNSSVYSNSKESESKSERKNACSTDDVELVLLKLLVFFQTFGFSFGRLLALGVLLKLAGIYAVSIMFLQLLISVIYLKFQAPILVSESLSKWRQLSRLAFMSYILIFEWHLNRDPKTGYDFSSNIKHSMLYYCVATIESVFYLVTWAITTSYASKSKLNDIRISQNTFCKVVLIIGTMALVFSLAMHIILLFWRSRRISAFICSLKKRYETTKLGMFSCGCRKDKNETKDEPKRRINIDISSPIPIKKCDEKPFGGDKQCDLEKHNSYRDLREPLDEEIEICFRKCDKSNYCDAESTLEDHTNVTDITKVKEVSVGRVFLKTLDSQMHHEINGLEKNAEEFPRKVFQPATIETTETNTCLDIRDEKKAEEKLPENSMKSKIIILSGSISEQLGKVSSVSRKVAGTMRDQIQKRKKQLQNLRSSSTANSKKNDDETSNSSSYSSNENGEGVEGYFVGDSRSYEEGSFQSVKAVTFSDNIISESRDGRQAYIDNLPFSDMVHTMGESPCGCYICKTLGDGRFRRRRSSSAPSGARNSKEGEDENGENRTLPRYLSNPNISQNLCEKNNIQKTTCSPKELPKSDTFLSCLPLDDRIEHYV